MWESMCKVRKPCSWDQEVHALKWYDAAACSQILAPSDTGQIQNVMLVMELLWLQSGTRQDWDVACTLHEVMGGYIFTTWFYFPPWYSILST